MVPMHRPNSIRSSSSPRLPRQKKTKRVGMLTSLRSFCKIRGSFSRIKPTTREGRSSTSPTIMLATWESFGIFLRKLVFGCKMKKKQYQVERNRNFSCLSGRARYFPASRVKLIVTFLGRSDRTRLFFFFFWGGGVPACRNDSKLILGLTERIRLTFIYKIKW